MWELNKFAEKNLKVWKIKMVKKTFVKEYLSKKIENINTHGKNSRKTCKKWIIEKIISYETDSENLFAKK